MSNNDIRVSVQHTTNNAVTTSTITDEEHKFLHVGYSLEWKERILLTVICKWVSYVNMKVTLSAKVVIVISRVKVTLSAKVVIVISRVKVAASAKVATVISRVKVAASAKVVIAISRVKVGASAKVATVISRVKVAASAKVVIVISRVKVGASAGIVGCNSLILHDSKIGNKCIMNYCIHICSFERKQLNHAQKLGSLYYTLVGDGVWCLLVLFGWFCGFHPYNNYMCLFVCLF